MTNISEEKYLILGGGYSGIGIGKCFTQAKIAFDIIERNDDFGGNWYYGSSSSKMYDSTHLISSKLNTQFSDFPMPDGYPNYPNHKLVLAYLRQVAKHFGLYDHVRFNCEVKSLEPVGDLWKVTLDSGEELTYKGVVVCNGMLRELIYPQYPGKFNGESLHSYDYRSSSQLAGKRVLIIGGGNSGCDLAVDSAHSAAMTYHSTRRGYYYMPKFIDGKPTQEWMMELARQFNSQTDYWEHVKKVFKLAGYDGVDYHLPVPDHEIYQAHPIMNSLVLYYIGHGDNIPKPDVKELKANSVVFEDGTEEVVDMIIYATGFYSSLPFLRDKHLTVNDHVPDLYAHAFHRAYDNILFCGYINTPGGIGNMANSVGRMAAGYFKALEKNSHAIQVFRKVKQGPSPDLGHKNYVTTKRHAYEVDMWEFVKFMNNLRAKFEEE
jgi:cation diffusion facilitator CzcD-associated flavoprotein CzcO